MYLCQNPKNKDGNKKESNSIVRIARKNDNEENECEGKNTNGRQHYKL